MPMAASLWNRYLWADEVMASTISVIRGPDDATLMNRMNLDPTSREDLDWDGASDRQSDAIAEGASIVQLDRLDDWTVVIEPNGFITPGPELTALLSTDGRAASSYWNVNALMIFAWAIDGHLRRWFDPLLGHGEGSPLPEEDALPFGYPGQPRAAMLALMERLTGVAIEQDWLIGPVRPSYLIPPRPR